MSFGPTQVPDSFVPDIAQEAIIQGIKGAVVLYGSPAVIVRNDLVVDSKMVVGDKIKFEYYGMIPPYEEEVPQGVALTPVKAANSTEQSPVFQHGLRVEWSMWYQCVERGKLTGQDPYVLYAAMFTKQFVQLAEKRLIVAARTGLDSAYINDISGNSLKMGWDAIADTKHKFGDEGEQVALMSCHSDVKNNLTKEKNSINQPLYVDPMSGSAEIPRIQGVALKVSDLNIVESGTYDTLFLRPNAVVMRHSNPTLEPWVDARSNSKGLISWVWMAEKRYQYLPGSIYPGVAICRSKG